MTLVFFNEEFTSFEILTCFISSFHPSFLAFCLHLLFASLLFNFYILFIFEFILTLFSTDIILFMYENIDIYLLGMTLHFVAAFNERKLGFEIDSIQSVGNKWKSWSVSVKISDT